MAVDLGLLPFVGCEAQLVEQRKKPAVNMDASCVAACKRARETAIGLLRGVEDDCGAAVVACLRKKAQIMYSLDKWWTVEFVLLESHVGEKGEQRLKDRIFASLPSAAVPKTVTESVKMLSAIEGSALLSFVGVGMASVFDRIFEWVKAIVGDRPPAFQGDTSDFLAQVKARLGHFCMFPKPEPEEGFVFARSAVAEHYKQAVELAAKPGDALRLTNLTPLHVFGWLLNPEEAKHVKDWTDAEYAKGSNVVSANATTRAAAKKGTRSKVESDALSKLEALIRG